MIKMSQIESLLKLSGPLLAVAAFAWGIYTYRQADKRDAENRSLDAKRTAETRRIEATRPYLDRQLTLFTEATRVQRRSPRPRIKLRWRRQQGDFTNYTGVSSRWWSKDLSKTP